MITILPRSLSTLCLNKQTCTNKILYLTIYSSTVTLPLLHASPTRLSYRHAVESIKSGWPSCSPATATEPLLFPLVWLAFRSMPPGPPPPTVGAPAPLLLPLWCRWRPADVIRWAGRETSEIAWKLVSSRSRCSCISAGDCSTTDCTLWSVCGWKCFWYFWEMFCFFWWYFPFYLVVEGAI